LSLFSHFIFWKHHLTFSSFFIFILHVQLGALGCGRSLVQLAIEQLEFQRATGSANYDYLALQATDNSIPFYESIGFVRVGAVIYDTKGNGDDSGGDSQPSNPTF
jgi:hypothetical protein